MVAGDSTQIYGYDSRYDFSATCRTEKFSMLSFFGVQLISSTLISVTESSENFLFSRGAEPWPKEELAVDFRYCPHSRLESDLTAFPSVPKGEYEMKMACPSSRA